MGDVETAELLDRERNGSGAGSRVGDIGPDEPPPEILSDGLATGDIDIGNHDVGAAPGQMPGHALTDSVASSSDESDLAVDVECHALDRRGPCSAQPTRGEGSGCACTTLRC